MEKKKKFGGMSVFFGYKSLAGFHHKEVESEINSGWNCKVVNDEK
jgi:hypothetical protein